MKVLRLLPLVPTTLAIFLSGCAIHPLGPLDRAPQHKAAKLTGYSPFAWGISTSSLQYEDRDEKQGNKDYSLRDWEVKTRHPLLAMLSIAGAILIRILPP